MRAMSPAPSWSSTAVTPRNKERSMSGVLDGAVALVTGAGGGIGGATVKAMLAAGAEVIATDLAAPTGGTLNLAQNVTDEAGWADLARAIERRWGRLDCLV